MTRTTYWRFERRSRPVFSFHKGVLLRMRGQRNHFKSDRSANLWTSWAYIRSSTCQLVSPWLYFECDLKCSSFAALRHRSRSIHPPGLASHSFENHEFQLLLYYSTIQKYHSHYCYLGQDHYIQTCWQRRNTFHFANSSMRMVMGCAHIQSYLYHYFRTFFLVSYFYFVFRTLFNCLRLFFCQIERLIDNQVILL